MPASKQETATVDAWEGALIARRGKWVPPEDRPRRRPLAEERRKECTAGPGRDAFVVDLALRFALDAPPSGLRRASLRPRPTTKTRRNQNKERTLLMR